MKELVMELKVLVAALAEVSKWRRKVNDKVEQFQDLVERMEVEVAANEND